MARHGRRRRGGGHEAEESDERWLLTYADMITLLMALFMVLFSISSVNTSKFEGLQRSLKDAFSGRVLPGGTSIRDAGGAATDHRVLAPPQAVTPSPQFGGRSSAAGPRQTEAAARAEAQDFNHLKQQLDAFAARHGLSGQVSTRIAADGLHIRVLTDKLLFDSGSATPKAASYPLLAKLGTMLSIEGGHAIIVEGHTDSVPIASAQFPTNWELSGARASAIVRALVAARVSPDRLTAAGRADRDPITSNDTAAGRDVNRRVEILLPRQVLRIGASGSITSSPNTTPAAQVAPDLSHPLGTRIVPRPATEASP